MFNRKIASAILNSKKSILLLGPRQVGKSTLIRSCNPEMKINLSSQREFLDFTSNPDELESRIKTKKPKTILIDEIQRVPSLLNTIQVIIDEYENAPKFYLTGSSARKLRRGQANLLPGRLSVYYLSSLILEELGSEEVDIKTLLAYGTMPGVLNEQKIGDKEKLLRDYAGIYLKEEIQAEALAKNIEGFSRFFKVVAANACDFLDLSKLCSQAQIKRATGIRYFEILEDTLILEKVHAFAKSERKRLIQHPKYFFFDVGIWNGILGNYAASDDRIGVLFEHFIYNQISNLAKAKDEEFKISSYRTEHGAEVDFIVETKKDTFAIEVKASKNIGIHDLKGFESFREFYGKKFSPMVIYMGEKEKEIANIPILPWKKALKIF